jgi:hypothetical protein
MPYHDTRGSRMSPQETLSPYICLGISPLPGVRGSNGTAGHTIFLCASNVHFSCFCVGKPGQVTKTTRFIGVPSHELANFAGNPSRLETPPFFVPETRRFQVKWPVSYAQAIKTAARRVRFLWVSFLGLLHGEGSPPPPHTHRNECGVPRDTSDPVK